MQIVYVQTYPLSTEDFIELLAPLKAANADILFICSYLKDSAGLVRAINASDYQPKMDGGVMIGTQSASVKKELGPLLNGFVNDEYWMPVPKMNFPGVNDLIARYQSIAIQENLDELGFYVVPLAYSQMQVLEQAIIATCGLDDEKLAEYCRANVFETVAGSVRFGEAGEWTEPRVIQMQFQNVNNSVTGTFKDSRVLAVVAPARMHQARFFTHIKLENKFTLIILAMN